MSSFWPLVFLISSSVLLMMTQVTISSIDTGFLAFLIKCTLLRLLLALNQSCSTPELLRQQYSQFDC